jgi:GT2 family glycosyltransferase
MPTFVGIASSGRGAILRQTLESVLAQTTPPDVTFVCTPEGEDRPTDFPAGLEVVWLAARKGLCAQRNAIMDAVGARDGVLLFVDDDFVLHPQYLEKAQQVIVAHPDVAVLNGALIADGIIGPGLSFEEARRLIAACPSVSFDQIRMVDVPTSYGCNMAVNLRLAGSTRFDETLPLYGWQEDVDFSARLRAVGRLVSVNIPVGVHLGVKLGRISGLRFGYSQIINPIYLLRKGTMTLGHATWLIGRNVTMNIVRSVWSEPYLDRRGRLVGNFYGFADILRGRGRPDRIFEF